MANGNAVTGGLNLAADVGVWAFVLNLFVVNEPSTPEARFPQPMHARGVTVRNGTREKTRGIFGNNFQGFRATTNPTALRDTSVLSFV